MNTASTRRAFLRRSAVLGGSLTILPRARLVWGAAANGKLNVAGIGTGGQGRGNLDNIASLGENLVALCDVDQARAGDIYAKHPQARKFTDFRRMLDEMEKQIDAVVVSTPDHTHAVAAVNAMLRGKHVYCEKPLTRTVHEARVMRETALKTKVATQMGNQGSASDGLRRGTELVLGGTLGEVREAHIWFDGGNAPLERPKDTPPVPATLDWDLWLGPAEYRPYHPSYLPASWRGWRAFGSGIVGDFGCHTGNLMFRSLRMTELWEGVGAGAKDRRILRVEAHPSERNVEGYPASMRVQIDVPARGTLPPVKLMLWAKERPSADLLFGYPQQGWGDLLVGAKGSIYSECPWNTRYTLLPETKFTEIKSGAPQSLPKSPGHHREWVEACKGQGKTFSPFEFGGPLTEVMQLANLATLVDGPIDYDIVSGRVLNHDTAQRLTHRDYRPGWVLGQA